ncbi:MAG: isoprenylcysteine carboxylmethyltransferase family protein [Steroidobacteraceae bacterium]
MHHAAVFYHRALALLWGAWALYWLISAVGTKRTLRRESLVKRLGYVLPLLIAAVLIGARGAPWAAWLSMRLWPHSPVPPRIGLDLVLAGLAFSVWARVHLGRNWSGIVTVKEQHELIRTGPYALVRHPIYTGIITAALGTAVVSATVRAAIGVLIIAAALVVKLRVEERFMRETFADQYARYCEEVPALVPFTKFRRSAPR